MFELIQMPMSKKSPRDKTTVKIKIRIFGNSNIRQRLQRSRQIEELELH